MMEWIAPSVLRHKRIDPSYYAQEHLETDALIIDASKRVTFDPLGSFCRLWSGPFGSKLPSSLYRDSGPYPLYRSQNVKHFWVQREGLVYLEPDAFEDLNSCRVDAKDILISKAGFVGTACIVGQSEGPGIITEHVLGVRPHDNTDRYYLLACLNSSICRRQLEREGLGTILSYLGVEVSRELLVPRPSAAIQLAIGNKVRGAECLRTAAETDRLAAGRQLTTFFDGRDNSNLSANSDGSCDYFASHVSPSDLELFHGAQFYAPKRKLAVDSVRGTGIAARVGAHGRRVRAKAKRIPAIVHVDPANVGGSDGYWLPGDEEGGGDVALAKPRYVLFLRMRPYLNKTTINDTDQTVSASPEFLIYRFDDRDAYYAALCLRQPWAQAQVAEIATGDRPRVDGEFVDDVVVPWPDQDTREEVGNLYKSSFALRRRADILVQQAIADVENLIDGKLDEAECLRQGKELAQEFGLEVPQ
jgi:type I restriction enzyme, S subunit